MATIIATEQINVVWPERTDGSSFALPGQNLSPVYLGTNYWLQVVVLDDFSTYAALTSGNVTANGVRASDQYTMGAWMRTSTWTWSYGADGVNVPDGAVPVASATIGVTANTGTGGDATHGYFDWGFPVIDVSGVTEGSSTDDATLTSIGFHPFGQLSGWEGDGQGSAYIYISGIGTYRVTDPIYPSPARITVPRIRRVIDDYYPWARKAGSAYTSYNDEGHYLQRIPGIQLKNKTSGDGSRVYCLQNGAWQAMPKLG